MPIFFSVAATLACGCGRYLYQHGQRFSIARQQRKCAYSSPRRRWISICGPLALIMRAPEKRKALRVRDRVRVRIKPRHARVPPFTNADPVAVSQQTEMNACLVNPRPAAAASVVACRCRPEILLRRGPAHIEPGARKTLNLKT